MNAIYENIERTGRFFVAYLVIFLLFILNVVFIPSTETGISNIALIMMAIYYWSIYRPMLIPPILVFIIGVCFDVLSVWPIGISALIFLLLRQSVTRQRLFLTGQPFTVVWLGFIGAITIASLIQWGIFSLIYWQAIPIYSSATAFVLSALMFPIISFALHLSHKLLPELHDQYTAVGN